MEPHPDHRWIEVTWDYATLDPADEDAAPANQDGAIGYAAQALDGDQERVLVRAPGFLMMALQGGTYDVVARVCTRAPRGRLPCAPVHGQARAQVNVN